MKMYVACVVLGLSALVVLPGFIGKETSKTQVIAHRGAWKKQGLPQNSLAALDNAIRLGCFGSEFDVHMAADMGLFVSHDHVIQNVAIEKSTSAELAAVKLSNGESLPTLEAYLLQGKKQKKTRLVLEIKPSQLGKERSLLLAQKCVEMVQKTKTQRLVDYISFDYEVCKKVKELDPKAQVAYLNGDKTPAECAADGLDGLDYNQNVYKKKEEWIQQAQQLNQTLNVWTVNTQQQMEWFVEKNFDFITTDEPERLLEMLKK
ncbi:glycerophosphodiester phosphodiesterase [Arundinibacter roseus]|uniref:Glycerophosphodiester phosphodiesterase n=1 Tax=Arundinibacter roseus TaxID=2070510 RepID=A0A4R4KDR4_9BACT|nr:glycerophosphodiester phosphodiesterase family protein [Arundinibacter roseus]TDB66018.1 glycerophosphodiester phosphodiesterase [Arundinibacter roseus]